MNDAAAAACVTDVPESVSANAAANAYVPSDGETADVSQRAEPRTS